MTLEQLRQLVALDPEDALSRFSLGQKLFAEGQTREVIEEAATHLEYANRRDPSHLATYHILAEVLIKLDRIEDAQKVLEAGIAKTIGVPEGMGGDLRPILEDLLMSL